MKKSPVMNSRQNGPPFRRVVVPFDASPQGRALLELASELALCFEASLSGLFIEHEGILDYAALPNTQEVTLSSAALRPLSRARMEAHCHAQERLAKRLFDSMVTRHRVPASFTAHRGAPQHAIALFSSRTDLVLLSPHVGFLAKPSPGALWETLEGGMVSGLISMTHPARALRSGTVIALVDDALSRAESIVSTTRAVSHLPGIGPGLIIQFETEESPDRARALEALAQGEEPLSYRFAADPQALQQLLAKIRPSLVVLTDELAERLREELIRQGHSLLVIRR